MTRTERLLELMQRLRRSRQPLQAHTLAEQLDISVRTLYRDIETLRRQGADIEGEAGVGYVLKKGGPTLPPLMFRESEIEALVLGLRWVGRHADPALADDARSALSKIGAILPPRLASIFDEHALYPAGRRQNTESDENSVLPTVRAALRENQRLRLDYTDGEGHTSQRIVWPLALGYFDETPVLAAWCELRQDFRHFRTDRMQRAQPVGPCPLPRLRMLAEWQRHTGVDLSRYDP
ncbi:YafY family protein [Lautropia mirabilis]|uniref:helix-turn-helix transcriptional regulator n=1 Tax=Lautropia mirabilis TaxID=47671 RepID=UPI001CAC615E|nr:YafY family protein [Lautropia mirabilis]MBF1238658.1 YafY family transcriptional regulator [Lautropia mirabilis]